MRDFFLVGSLAIVVFNLCISVFQVVKYTNELVEAKHKENRIADYIFAKCQKLSEQEEEMLSKRGVINVSEFGKIDAKIDVLLELMEEINKEEEEE